MSAPKNLARWALLAKLEAAYGTFAAPAAATDGIVVVERPDVTLEYLHDGSRGHSTLKRVAKSGRAAALAAIAEAAGFGAAYAAASTPNIHALLRAAGYDAAVATGLGTEKWTYTPTAHDAVQASLSIESYVRGQRQQIAGALGSLKIEGENGGIPRWTFDLNGISNALPADAAVPAVTYAGAQVQDPPKLDGLGLTIGAWTPGKVKSFSYEDPRALAARAMDNTQVAGGRHGGFQPAADRPITLNVVVESVALATYNAYQLAEACDNRAVTLKCGATQYRRWAIAGAIAQLVGLPEQDENNAAMWELQFELKPSTFMGSDASTITFD